MGSKKLYLFLVLIISVSSIQFAQISDITRFPYQNQEKEYKESTPVIISENEILFFYCTGNSKGQDYWNITDDTLYLSKSTNGGMSWSQPKFISVLGRINQNQFWFLTSLRTNSNRIILAWADWAEGNIVLTHSDDNGSTWSDTTSIATSSKLNLNLSELDEERIILSYNNNVYRAYYRESLDDGETWSENPITFYVGSGRMKNLSFLNVGSKLLSFFEFDSLGSNPYSGIYYRESSNNGLTWSGNNLIVDSDFTDSNPSVIKYSDQQLLLIYQLNHSFSSFYGLNDIYTVESFDSGETWSIPEQFTSYVGDDNIVQSVKYDEKAFITFSSTRYTNKPQLCYAKIGETVESFRPPYITNVEAQFDSLSRRKWLIKADVFDDEKVVTVKVHFEDGTIAELFDDGKHGDSDSLDNQFANTVVLSSISPSAAGLIDVNELILPFNNKGVLADVSVKFSQTSVFESLDSDAFKSEYKTIVEASDLVRAEYQEGEFLFSGGFVMSGYTNGTLWANAQASAMLVEDYLPGKAGSDRDDPLNKIYTIYNDDPPFGYSWQRWKDAVSLGAEYYDGDNDGVYNPVDKNWNSTWDSNEDMPMLIGNETAWCVYNDGVPKELRRWNTVDPQGIEIRQTIFAADNSELKNVIFIRYSILNTGTVTETMDSVYFGIWDDGDLGEFTNDRIGCDTTLNSGFYYESGPDGTYGNNPPSFFTTILQGPIIETNSSIDTARNYFGEMLGSEIFTSSANLNMTSHMFFVGGDPIINDPNNSIIARNYLQGKTNNGLYPDPCNFPYCEVRGGVDCNEVNPVFWASGDPVTDYGWLFVLNIDCRNMISSGPFLLEKDKPQDIIIAYVMGRGTDHFNSITVARENVQRAIQEYQSNFASMTYSPPPATNPVKSYVLYQNYPNPFNPTTTIRYELPQDGVVTIELFDILGQKVKTLLNEFQIADRYEVNFNANSIASGVYIYQLRVNDFITSKKMLLIK